MIELYDLRTEGLREPEDVDVEQPRFSWKMRSDERNVLQSSVRIRLFQDQHMLWDSGIIQSDVPSLCYSGEALPLGKQVCWQLTVTTNTGAQIKRESFFEVSWVLGTGWPAKWIQPERQADYNNFKPAAYLRRLFCIRKPIQRARISQSAHGLYNFLINGIAGTDDRFTPGFTSYQLRTQYQTYDVTDLLRQGENVWAVLLGDGWWRGSTGGGNRNNFGFYTAYIGQLLLEYTDGTCELIVTDEEFRTSEGPIRRCDMKYGELYDARLEKAGWACSDYDDGTWNKVILATEYPITENLIPSRSVPVREHEHFVAQPFRDKSGALILDFGQNHAGYVRMRLRNTQPGQEIVLQHGEGLKDGCFSLDNLEESTEHPLQQVCYRCNGKENGESAYQPTFSVFGYRYVKLEGYDENLIQPGDFISIAVYSDMDSTGKFQCSNPLINQLVQNSIWSQKSNFLDVPTDCPTRERAPWSGDAQVYCKTASMFMDVFTFFRKWLEDLKAEQFESGCVGNTIPSANALHNEAERQLMLQQGRVIFAPPTMAGPGGEGDFMDGAAGWGDAAVIVPWMLYLCYGDIRILKEQYLSAKRWVDFCCKNAAKENPLYREEPQYHNYVNGVSDATYIYDTHFHWGEWLEPDAVENGGSQSFNPIEMAERGNPLVATAYLFYSSMLLGKMAALLGYEEDERFYGAYAQEVKRVYNRYFVGADGTILPGRQAPYVRTLAFNLVDDEKRTAMIERLTEAVEQAGYTVNTGFLSTPFLLNVLADNGCVEHAYRTLEQTDFPSWLHPITIGATTIPENWNSFDTYAGSFNHYSYGAVCDFLFSRVAGIRVIEEKPGYQEFLLQPIPGGSLSYAEASYESPSGLICARWDRTTKGYTYCFEIPANTTARLILPDGTESCYGSGCYEVHFS